MATAEHPAPAPTPRDERPITRTELREELAYALRDYVTKTELHEQLSSALQYYATKADLAELETRMVERMAAMESRLVRWMIGMMFGSILAAAAIASVVALLLSS